MPVYAFLSCGVGQVLFDIIVSESVVSINGPCYKKDGSLRICIDYRRLNSVSQVDAYAMPQVDELLDRLGKAKFISTMDST